MIPSVENQVVTSAVTSAAPLTSPWGPIPHMAVQFLATLPFFLVLGAAVPVGSSIGWISATEWSRWLFLLFVYGGLATFGPGLYRRLVAFGDRHLPPIPTVIVALMVVAATLPASRLYESFLRSTH